MAEWVEKGSIKGPPGEIPDVSDFLRDGDVSSAISGSAEKVASDKAVKDYVDAQVSSEATSRQEQDATLLAQIGGKANVKHSHEMTDVTGLNDKITQIESSVSDAEESVTSLSTDKADKVHTHTTAQVDGLDAKLTEIQSDVDSKADAVHTHEMSAVIGLDDALAEKADSEHTHAIGDVTGLQDELNDKSDVGHKHVTADVTDLQGKLDAKSNTGHTHEIANVNGLQTALDGKAASKHSHETSDITGLDSKISEIEGDVAGKADSAHTHDAADVVSGTLVVDRIPSIPDSKIESVSATKLTGTVPQANLPSYVDDVIEADDYASLPPTGEAGKIYVDKETNKTYRWGGSAYVEISASLALGETSATAFRGDYGKVAYDHAQAKGSEFATGFYKITTNAEGHVISATAVTKGDITTLGIPAQDTTYVDATGSASGLMSAADKMKLDGIANGANNYTHPTSAAGALGSNIYKITTDADGHIIAATPIAKGDITALGIPSEDTNTTYTAGSGLTLSGTEFGIADDGIIGRYLDDNCVMERNIAVGAVTSDKIPALAITTPKLVDNAVTAIKMADDAVATRSIQDGAVTADKIAEGVIPESVSYDVATTEANGLMSKDDKASLDNLKTNAVTTDASGYVQKSPFKFKNYDGSVEMNFTSKTETSLDLEFRTATGNDVVTISADNLFGEASGGVALGDGATLGMGDKSVNGIIDAVGEGADGTKLVTDKAVKDAIDAIEIPDPLPSGGTDGQVLTKTADGEAWEDIPDYENATTEYDGLMSAADKTKLDGIAEGANNYVHPASAAGAKTSGLYKVTTDAQGHVTGAVDVVKSDITALGIPAQDTTYVDATTGTSGLMSAADKTKLDGIQTGADKLPDGGTVGQVLTKTSDGEAWQDALRVDSYRLLSGNSPVSDVSIGTDSGNSQVQISAQENESGIAWYDPSGGPSLIISAGVDGWSLQDMHDGHDDITSITDDASTGDTSALATAKAVKDYANSVGVPSGGTSGQILTKTGDGAVWASAKSGKVFYVICPRYFVGNENNAVDLPVNVCCFDANGNINDDAYLIGIQLHSYLYEQGADEPDDNIVIEVHYSGRFVVQDVPAPTNDKYWIYDFYLSSTDTSDFSDAEAIVSVTVSAPPLRTTSDENFKAYMGIS